MSNELATPLRAEPKYFVGDILWSAVFDGNGKFLFEAPKETADLIVEMSEDARQLRGALRQSMLGLVAGRNLLELISESDFKGMINKHQSVVTISRLAITSAIDKAALAAGDKT